MGIGYDFSDDDSVIEEQRDAARQVEEWFNLDSKAIAGELNGLNSRVTACALGLSKMISENDYKKTKNKMEALLAKDLGPDGWMECFRKANGESFAFEKRAEMKKGLSPEEKEKYETVCKFYEDTYYLLNATADIFNLIRMVPLEDGFRIIKIKENFESAGFDESLYKRVDSDLAKISVLLNLSWDELERNTEMSKRFIDENIKTLNIKELEKKYRKVRMYEYKQRLKNLDLLNSFYDVSDDGHYAAKPYILAVTGVVDRYTYKISQTAEIKDKLQATIDTCKKAREGAIADAEKNCVTQAAQFLCAALDELVKAIADFAEMALEVYMNFKEGKPIAPYCFMKKLSSLSSVKPKYSFSPNTSDPWDSGTYYRDIYTEAANALGSQVRLFAYDHGATFN